MYFVTFLILKHYILYSYEAHYSSFHTDCKLSEDGGTPQKLEVKCLHFKASLFILYVYYKL